MRVLVTGGAGYIGSVVVEELLAHGDQPVVYDNLSKGHRESIPAEAEFIRGELLDTKEVARVLVEWKIEAVVHMAADSIVSESFQNPGKYYANNVNASLSLLQAMRVSGVSRIVLSSTAAVYGEPAKQPITESAPTHPANPYGETKLALERALHWFEQAHGQRYVSLRYFNAAGATLRCGELHDPETHLIPIILEVATGRRPYLEIFGNDYPTRDGTCVRDYIHVSDLARAHLLALGVLANGSAIFNLGCGGGHTVLEVVEAARKVTGQPIRIRYGARRPGDPAVLVASSQKIQHELNWQPAQRDLHTIIESAWKWMRQRPTLLTRP